MGTIDTVQIYTIMISFIIGILTGGVSFCLVFGIIEKVRMPRIGRKKRKKEKDPEEERERSARPRIFSKRTSYFDQDDDEEDEDLRSPDEIRRMLHRQDKSNKYFINDSKGAHGAADTDADGAQEGGSA